MISIIVTPSLLFLYMGNNVEQYRVLLHVYIQPEEESF